VFAPRTQLAELRFAASKVHYRLFRAQQLGRAGLHPVAPRLPNSNPGGLRDRSCVLSALHLGATLIGSVSESGYITGYDSGERPWNRS
jgi:hypothetical protein